MLVKAKKILRRTGAFSAPDARPPIHPQPGEVQRLTCSSVTKRQENFPLCILVEKGKIFHRS